ncbi:MAG: phospholipase A [Bdellovibrionales bacterium]
MKIFISISLIATAFYSYTSFSEDIGRALPLPAEVAPISQPPDAVYDRLLDSRYSLFPHKGTYFFPYSHNSTPHPDLYQEIETAEHKEGKSFYEKTEAEFQISFLVPVLRKIAESHWDFMVAYTHHSWWQAYNTAWSKPFRETNYMPEVFFRYFERDLKQNDFGFTAVAFDVGYSHESNGQIQALSRSWDRLQARLALVKPSFLVRVSFWYRLPETTPDDNPHLLRFRGTGEIEFRKSFMKHTFSLQTPVGAQYLSLAASYSYPWRNHLRWVVSYEYGYGHSLIEYDRRVERIAFGLALENLLDRQ